MKKSTGCFSTGPGFDSQHTHGGTQLSVTPVPGDLTPSSGFCVPCTYVVYRHTWRQSTHTQRIHLNGGGAGAMSRSAPESLGFSWSSWLWRRSVGVLCAPFPLERMPGEDFLMRRKEGFRKGDS